MRVILISGEPAFRCGFRAVIERSGDLELVAEAADARAGFQAIDAEAPDVVVIDVTLRGMNGPAATREVKRRAPAAHVLLLASWPRERDVLEGFAAHADGFALKSEPIESLIHAIRSVGLGKRYLAPEMRGLASESARAIDRSRSSGRPADVLDALSAREREVLDLVIRGWRNREMARELCVSIKTIDTHRTRINRKLRCRSGAELIRFAAENGLLRETRTPPTGAAEVRTIMMFVEDNPEIRAALMRTASEQGYRESHVGSVTSAMAELDRAEAASLCVVDAAADGTPVAELYRHLCNVERTPAPLMLAFDLGPGAPPVRAVASLPDAETGERFVAAFDRAVAAGARSPAA